MSDSYLLPPKIMQWDQSLQQSHLAIRPVLITNGASFTVGTNQLQYASSWPGYVYERCRLNKVVDLSYPGRTNSEIYDTTVDYFHSIDTTDNLFCMIMWNGLADDVDHDYELVMGMMDFFKNISVPYAFTFYANLFFPPILPRRDVKKNFYKNISQAKVQHMMSNNYYPLEKEHYLYDFAFFHDMLDDCQYHPNMQCRLKWTDEILLPEITRLGLADPI